MGQQPWTGWWPQTWTWNCPCVFLCVVHQSPENGSWEFLKRSDYWFVWREVSEGWAVQPPKAWAVWEKSDQDQVVALWLKAAFLLPPKTTQSLKKHFHHPVKARLCYCCESTRWSEQLHHIPVSFWEGKCIFNTDFQMAPSHTPCGLLLKDSSIFWFG